MAFLLIVSLIVASEMDVSPERTARIQTRREEDSRSCGTAGGMEVEGGTRDEMSESGMVRGGGGGELFVRASASVRS